MPSGISLQSTLSSVLRLRNAPVRSKGPYGPNANRGQQTPRGPFSTRLATSMLDGVKWGQGATRTPHDVTMLTALFRNSNCTILSLGIVSHLFIMFLCMHINDTHKKRYTVKYFDRHCSLQMIHHGRRLEIPIIKNLPLSHNFAEPSGW